jgi:NitT/TauT family transport system substrate-binding protein
MAGKPRTPFFIVLGIVVVLLVVFAVWRSDIFAPKGGNGEGEGDIDPSKLGIGDAEAPDDMAPTTVQEYEFVPDQKLPPVKGTSAYEAMENDTVRFALNVWAGWAPIIMANEGFKAGKVWHTQEGKPFQVELVLIDDPVVMRDAYATGQVHIGWATLDMVPLFMEGFVKRDGTPLDTRIMPRIFQQVDWSNGGDGIVARADIKSVGDLRGKTIVLAQNSPSQYFALNMLVASGVQPSEVKWVYTKDAFQAAAAFNSEKSISAAVSWAPDIYNLEKVRGNQMLITTVEANKLIADVWFARADFAKDHPDICEALVRGIFDAMVDLKTDAGRQRVAELMAAGYNLPASEALAMLGDAHSTNWAENYQFFLNRNNPTNFERVWDQAYYLYRRIGSIKHQPVPFDQVMDFSIIQKLGKESKYSTQVDEYKVDFTGRGVSEIEVEDRHMLTTTIVIHFYPNNWDLYKTITREIDGKTVEQLYDPNVDNVLEDVAKIVGQFGMAQIVIEGHTDSSMKGRVSAALVKELALKRANAVREALVQKYSFNPKQFAVAGYGWDRPAEPGNHTRNRRVEVKIYSPEAK